MAVYGSKTIRDMVNRVINETATDEDYVKLASIPDDCWRDFMELEAVKIDSGFFDTREDTPARVTMDWVNQIRSEAKKYHVYHG